MEPIEKSLGITGEHLKWYPAIAAENFSKDVTGKSVIVTGGGYGIGAAITKAYAQAGAKEIFVLGRNKARLDEAISQLAQSFKSTKFVSHSVDITSAEDTARFFGSLEHSADILVNNAGYLASPSDFVTTDLKEYWKVFEVNVLGTLQFTQAYLQHRREHPASGRPATVITINTVAAYYMPAARLSSYAASKAALNRWNEIMAVEIPETEARFISLHPGAVATDMNVKSGLQDVIPHTEAKLTADFTVFVSTEQASFLNGRFAWVNWDIEKLLAKKDEIVSGDFLKTTLTG